MNWTINAQRELLQRKYIKDLGIILEKIEIKPKSIEAEISNTVKFYKIDTKGIKLNMELTQRMLESNGYIVKKSVHDYKESFIVVMVNKQI